MTNAELAILSLIVEKPRHGYEVEQVIEARGMRNWTDIGFSSIYYLLNKLKAKGLISVVQQQTEGRGPARKVYQTTKAGYQEWYQKSLETLRSPAQQLVPFLLGLSVLPAFKMEKALEAIQAYLTSLEERRAELIRTEEGQKPIPPHVATMFDYSRAMIDCEIQWIDGLIHDLEAGKYFTSQ
jgi:DNA-binding PadR family transcriptional regulator